MIKKQIYTFLLRWVSSCLAMYAVINICATIDRSDIEMPIFVFYVLSGFVFALINTIVKPFATLFSLPILLVTWGLFTILINAGMIALTVFILPGVNIGFWGSIGGALLISLINHLLNFIMPEAASKVQERGGACLQRSEEVKETANFAQDHTAETVEAQLKEDMRYRQAQAKKKR